MSLCVVVDVFLRKSVVDDENFVTLFILTDAEIGWLDISMKEAFIMEELQNIEHIDRKPQRCSHRELATANGLHKIKQTWTE